jgi:hypothetical protein
MTYEDNHCICSRQPIVGLAVSEIILCTNNQLFSGLMTAHTVDHLPLYRDFPGNINREGEGES